MKLVEVALENFRAYRARTTVQIHDLTVLVGTNDSGKSSIMDALHIVLGDGKIDPTDINVRAADGDSVVIECAFDELPPTLTLDSGSTTSLADEYLVDSDGRLRLRWVHAVKGDDATRKIGAASPRAFAFHPTTQDLDALHGLKNAKLKRLVREAGIEGSCDLNNNASMRSALWEKAHGEGTLQCQEREIELAKDDGKAIFSQIQKELPLFALFRADRPSTDQDSEVQDPMKLAIRAALEELQGEIDAIKQRVRDRALDVANRTLTSLTDFDPSLASSLRAEFGEPKLDSAFKLSLVGDDGIAVNKRGSGVRRLVLFSFFRAEAERRQTDSGGRGIIYAVEEPETAQHPDFQRMVVQSLHRLSECEGCQVVLTTHSPGIAGLLPASSLRLVREQPAGREVVDGDEVLPDIVQTLGVIPDHRVRVLVCVEGPYDRAFLQSACEVYRSSGEDLACLKTDPAVAFVLLGGSTLSEWVSSHLLRHTMIPEFHLYDGDIARYGDAVNEVNQRGAPHSARQTRKRELENYLHPDAIQRVLAGPSGNLGAVTFGDQDDVEAVVAAAMPDHQGNPRRKLQRRALKHWLNHEVAAAMTRAEFDSRDPDGEILGWLSEITRLVRLT